MNQYYLHDGNDRTEAIEVPDPAFISRITGVLDYNDMPDLRSPNGEFQTINRKDWNPGGDVPKSVAPLLPATLEHGTSSDVTGANAGAGCNPARQPQTATTAQERSD